MLARITRLLLCLAIALLVRAQIPLDEGSASDAADVAASPVSNEAVPNDPISNDRIFGLIPNFQTVSDPTIPYVALRVRDKWKLFIKESVDPFAFFSAAAGAGISQWHK